MYLHEIYRVYTCEEAVGMMFPWQDNHHVDNLDAASEAMACTGECEFMAGDRRVSIETPVYEDALVIWVDNEWFYCEPKSAKLFDLLA